mgnify:CR=1 FL=1
MSQKIQDLLKNKDLGVSTLGLKKVLNQKAFEAVKKQFPEMRKSIVKKTILESCEHGELCECEQPITESSVYDSIVDYAHNATELSQSFPAQSVLNVKFNDFSEAEITLADAKLIVDGLKKIKEPVVKQQVINMLDLSAKSYSKVVGLFQSKRSAL